MDQLYVSKLWRNMNSKADLTPGRHKRLKTCTDGKYHDIGMDFSASKSDEITPQKPVRTHSNAVDFSSPFFILDGLESGKFGSVAKDIQALLDRKMQSPNLYSKSFPSPENGFLDVGKDELKPASKFMNRKTTRSEGDIVIIDLEDEFPANETQTTSIPVMIIDSDGEDMGDQTDEKPSLTSRNVLTDHPAGETLLKDVKEDKHVHVDIKDERNHLHDTEVGDSVDACVVDLTQIEEDECVHDEPPREISFKDVEEDKQVHVDKEDEDNQLPISEDGDFKDPCVEVLTEIKEDEPVCDQPAGETLLKDIEEDKDGHVGIEDKGSRPPNTEDGDLGDVCVEDDTEIKEDGFLYDQPSGETLLKDIEENKEVHVGIQDEDNLLTHSEDGGLEDVCGEDATEIQEDGCVHVGTEDEGNESSNEDDGLEHCWREMSMALELSKDVSEYRSGNKQVVEESEDEDKCPHSFILKDDLGYVCRICGVIDKGIETIFEFQYSKVKRSSRTYMRGLWNSKDGESTGIGGLNLSSDNLSLNEVYAHPRHANKMKPHQVEGFNFLVSNLVGDNPGGCILAHAPGSGKTFMVISFLQSFMVKYPNARPLVVLPKGILDTWKKEFRIWQIEDIPLYDLQMDNRFQQLAVLKQWVENRSILFLGYQKFSSIVCDTESSDITNSCREILLKAPSILFLDEGHTPRNDSTDIFQALAMVQTPRKVILSGTLYQNKVKEVFTLLNLVRPGFLGTETSQPIIQRIMSKVDMSFSTVRKNFKACSDVAFYDVVEGTLQKDKDFRRKVSVINDLREMTSKVLHYYKGDFLDELPGLVDFTVVLHLSSSQKREVEKIKLQNKFKAISVGASVYLHPKLRSLSDNPNAIDDEIDEVLEKIVVEDGAKAKFFCNVLSLCESKDEKLLVFSQYITPLKFLERLLEKEKGWCRGREIFLVSGDSHQNDRKLSMECFNNSPKARVFFGSIKACGEGISLVGASRVIILDVHLNPSVTRQAIGRAFRPGQTKKVVVYRLVAADSPEVEDYETCFRKELISKLWFEWKEYCGYRDFEVETVDVNECGDEFLESNPILAKDVKVLYRR